MDDLYSCASGGIIAAGYYSPFALISAIPANTWALIGGNTVSAVNPAIDPLANPNYPADAPWIGSNGHPSVMSAWSGAAWDESTKSLYITGGGHADYAGNEVYLWSATTGLFTRLNNPTGAVGNTGTLNDGLDGVTPAYFDGRPRSAHTYNHLRFIDGVLWNFQGSTYSGGAGKRGAFKFYGGDWHRNGTTTFGNNYGGTLYDTTRSRFISMSPGTGRPIWYDPVSDTTGQYSHWSNNNDSFGSELQCVYLPSRDLVVSFTQDIQLFKLDDSADSTAATTSGIAVPWTDNRLIGAVYDAENDRILCWHGGSSIYVLTPPATLPLSNTWTWSKVDPAVGNTVTPTAAASNGTYGRFWYSPSLKCCGVVNATNQKMYVFKLG